MGEYSVGIATRNRIYEVSKHLFYEKGINATSYADICREADVNRGLIPYYFKSKANIAIEVLAEFYRSMDSAVIEHWGKEGLTAPEFSIMVELMMFRLLEENGNVLNFYGEVFGDAAYHDATIGEQELVMRQLAAGSAVNVSDDALRSITCMVNGTESELVLALRDGVLTECTEDYVRRDILACYFLLGSDVGQASSWCDKTFELAKGLTMCCDDEFTCTIVPEGKV